MNKEQLTDIPNYDLGDIILRPIQFSDYKDMFAYGSDDEVTKYLSWSSFQSLDQAKTTMNKVFLSRPERNLPLAHAIVHKKTNKMIGTCDFPSVDWEKKVATLGYCLSRDYWGLGYMTKAVKQIISFAFDYLGIDKIRVQHHPKNMGSKNVILKTGFTYVEEIYNSSLAMVLPTYERKK